MTCLSSAGLIKCKASAGLWTSPGPTLMSRLRFLTLPVTLTVTMGQPNKVILMPSHFKCHIPPDDGWWWWCWGGGGGGHLLTTPSALAPSSLEDKSPCFERLDRSGSLVPDQISSISQAEIYFVMLPRCLFLESSVTVTYIWPSLMILRRVGSVRFHGLYLKGTTSRFLFTTKLDSQVCGDVKVWMMDGFFLFITPSKMNVSENGSCRIPFIATFRALHLKVVLWRT